MFNPQFQVVHNVVGKAVFIARLGFSTKKNKNKEKIKFWLIWFCHHEHRKSSQCLIYNVPYVSFLCGWKMYLHLIKNIQ